MSANFSITVTHNGTPTSHPTNQSVETARKGDEIKCEVASTSGISTYNWTIVFTPDSPSAVASSAALISPPGSTQYWCKFNVDHEGSYLVRLITDLGTSNEDTVFLRVRSQTRFGDLKLPAAGERKDTVGSIPVDIDIVGWADNQNQNLQRLLAYVRRVSTSGRVLYVDANRGRKSYDASQAPNDHTTNLVSMPGPDSASLATSGVTTYAEGFADFFKIQDAIAYANTAATRGEPAPSADQPYVILVRNGLYEESLVFEPHIHIVAADLINPSPTAQTKGVVARTKSNAGHLFDAGANADLLVCMGIQFETDDGASTQPTITHKRGKMYLIDCAVLHTAGSGTSAIFAVSDPVSSTTFTAETYIIDSYVYNSLSTAGQTAITANCYCGKLFIIGSTVFGDSAIKANPIIANVVAETFDLLVDRSVVAGKNGSNGYGILTNASTTRIRWSEVTSSFVGRTLHIGEGGSLAKAGDVKVYLSFSDFGIAPIHFDTTGMVLANTVLDVSSCKYGDPTSGAAAPGYVFAGTKPNIFATHTQAKSIHYQNNYPDPFSGGVVAIPLANQLGAEDVQDAIDDLAFFATTQGAFNAYGSLDVAYDGFTSVNPPVAGSGAGRKISADAGPVVIQASSTPALPNLSGAGVDKFGANDPRHGHLQIEGSIEVGGISAPEIELDPNYLAMGPRLNLGHTVWPSDIAANADRRSLPAGIIQGNSRDSSHSYNLRLQTQSSTTTSNGSVGWVIIQGGDTLETDGATAGPHSGDVFLQGGSYLPATQSSGINCPAGTIFVIPGASTAAGADEPYGWMRLVNPLAMTAATLTANAAATLPTTCAGNITFATPMGEVVIELLTGYANMSLLLSALNTAHNGTEGVLRGVGLLVFSETSGKVVVTTTAKGELADVVYVSDEPTSPAVANDLNLNLGEFKVSSGAVYVAGTAPEFVNLHCSNTQEITIGGAAAGTMPMIYDAVTGKLTVPGLIDPKGMIFDEVAYTNANVPTAANQGALFVSDGSASLTDNGLYYKAESDATPVLIATSSGLASSGDRIENAAQTTKVIAQTADTIDFMTDNTLYWQIDNTGKLQGVMGGGSGVATHQFEIYNASHSKMAIKAGTSEKAAIDFYDLATFMFTVHYDNSTDMFTMANASDLAKGITIDHASGVVHVGTSLKVGVSASVVITGIIDDDTMSSASADTLSTSESVKAYVDANAVALADWSVISTNLVPDAVGQDLGTTTKPVRFLQVQGVDSGLIGGINFTEDPSGTPVPVGILHAYAHGITPYDKTLQFLGQYDDTLANVAGSGQSITLNIAGVDTNNAALAMFRIKGDLINAANLESTIDFDLYQNNSATPQTMFSLFADTANSKIAQVRFEVPLLLKNYATGSLPSSGTILAGTIAYDSTTNEVKVWDGGNWSAMGGSGGLTNWSENSTNLVPNTATQTFGEVASTVQTIFVQSDQGGTKDKGLHFADSGGSERGFHVMEGSNSYGKSSHHFASTYAETKANLTTGHGTGVVWRGEATDGAVYIMRQISNFTDIANLESQVDFDYGDNPGWTTMFSFFKDTSSTQAAQVRFETPLALNSYPTASLPTATEYRDGALVFDTTVNAIKVKHSGIWNGLTGSGNLSGSGSAQQVGVFDGAGNVVGQAELLFDSANKTLTVDSSNSNMASYLELTNSGVGANEDEWRVGRDQYGVFRIDHQGKDLSAATLMVEGVPAIASLPQELILKVDNGNGAGIQSATYTINLNSNGATDNTWSVVSPTVASANIDVATITTTKVALAGAINTLLVLITNYSSSVETTNTGPNQPYYDVLLQAINPTATYDIAVSGTAMENDAGGGISYTLQPFGWKAVLHIDTEETARGARHNLGLQGVYGNLWQEDQFIFGKATGSNIIKITSGDITPFDSTFPNGTTRANGLVIFGNDPAIPTAYGMLRMNNGSFQLSNLDDGVNGILLQFSEEQTATIQAAAATNKTTFKVQGNSDSTATNGSEICRILQIEHETEAAPDKGGGIETKYEFNNKGLGFFNFQLTDASNGQEDSQCFIKTLINGTSTASLVISAGKTTFAKAIKIGVDASTTTNVWDGAAWVIGAKEPSTISATETGSPLTSTLHHQYTASKKSQIIDARELVVVRKGRDIAYPDDINPSTNEVDFVQSIGNSRHLYTPTLKSDTSSSEEMVGWFLTNTQAQAITSDLNYYTEIAIPYPANKMGGDFGGTNALFEVKIWYYGQCDDIMGSIVDIDASDRPTITLSLHNTADGVLIGQEAKANTATTINAGVNVGTINNYLFENSNADLDLSSLATVPNAGDTLRVTINIAFPSGRTNDRIPHMVGRVTAKFKQES